MRMVWPDGENEISTHSAFLHETSTHSKGVGRILVNLPEDHKNFHFNCSVCRAIIGHVHTAAEYGCQSQKLTV